MKTTADMDMADKHGKHPPTELQRGAHIADEMHRASIALLQEKLAAAEARCAELEHAARCCARELSCVAEVEPAGGPLLAHTAEGDACVALVERLCGKMRVWPIEEDNAQEILRAALAGGGEK